MLTLYALSEAGYGYNPRVDDFAKKLSRLLDAQPDGQMGVARRAFPNATPKQQEARGGYLSKLATGRETNPSMATFVWIARGMQLTLPSFFTQLEAADTSSLNQTRHSAQDSQAVTLRSEVPDVEEASAAIDPYADRLAAALVAFVRAEVARGDRPPASARPQKPASRRRVRRRQRKSP